MTGEILVGWLIAEGRSGRMHAGTAASRRSAVREVLQRAVPDGDSDKFPFQEDDVEDLVTAFVSAVAEDFEEGTVRSYRSNFQRTVELYLDSLESAPADDVLTIYRFPVRPGLVAEMHLPTDLTSTEAKRLANLLLALPVDG